MKQHRDHFVQIFGHDTDDSCLLIYMEFVPHGTLQNYITKHPLQEYEAIKVTTQLAQALQYMHAAKFIHRDLKPQVSSSTLFDQGGVLLTDECTERSREQSCAQLARQGRRLRDLQGHCRDICCSERCRSRDLGIHGSRDHERGTYKRQKTSLYTGCGYLGSWCHHALHHHEGASIRRQPLGHLRLRQGENHFQS